MPIFFLQRGKFQRGFLLRLRAIRLRGQPDCFPQPFESDPKRLVVIRNWNEFLSHTIICWYTVSCLRADAWGRVLSQGGRRAHELYSARRQLRGKGSLPGSPRRRRAVKKLGSS